MHVPNSFLLHMFASWKNANGCGHNTSPPWFLIKSSIACSWTSMSQHLPTSISHTKLEIATYIHELADKLHPSTTSQYILLGTTQLAPTTTLHYKTCKNYFPVLLCTTKLAQSTPQYYFVLQSLHKVVSSMLQFAAPKPDVDAKARKKTILKHFLKRNFKRKITSAKFAKICWQMTIAAWMQPLQYDLQSSAAKDNSITHAAAAASNLEAATPMRSAETELQITIAHRRAVAKPFIVACSHFTRKNTRFRAPASSPKQSPCNIKTAIPMRSFRTDSKTPYNYAHTSTPKAAWSHRYTAANKKR